METILTIWICVLHVACVFLTVFCWKLNRKLKQRPMFIYNNPSNSLSDIITGLFIGSLIVFSLKKINDLKNE